MEWSKETTMEFLNLYENEPVIWNASHPLHKQRNEVFDAWKRIEQKLGTGSSVPDLKRKKESLMARFRQCQAKVKKTTKTGASRDSVYKPIWFAYEKMAAFLQYKDEPRKTQNSVQMKAQQDSTNDREDNVDDTDESDDVQSDEGHDDNLGVQEDVKTELITDQALQTCTTEVDTFKAPLQRKSKRRTGTGDPAKLEKRMEDAYNILEASTKTNENRCGKDECGIYGDLVASKLRKLDEVTRDDVMNQIDNFLYQVKRLRTNVNNINQQLPRLSQQSSTH